MNIIQITLKHWKKKYKMNNLSKKNNYRFIAFVYIMLLLPFCLIINSSQASAWSGKYFLDGGCSKGHNVVQGGLPNWSYSNKEAFINYVLNSAPQLAKNYFVRTMLGQDASSSWSGTSVSNSEVTDWLNRIRGNNISIGVEGYSTETNTLRCGGTISGGGYNIVKYNEKTPASKSSVVFRNNNGSVVYVIKIDCANPLGDLPGLPVATRYSLSPSISTNSAAIVESGSGINLHLKVNNNGNMTSNNTNWWVTRTIDGKDNGKVFLDTRTFGVGDNEWDKTDAPSEASAGAQVCYVLSLSPRSNDNNSEVSSNKICIKIGKKPKFQIWGGSFWVGGSVQTSTSTKNMNGTSATFGSWDEYGIFSTGTLTGMASGSAFASANGLSGVNSACDYSKLSFANSNSNGNCDPSTVIGNYTNSKSIPDIASNFPTNASTPAASSDLSALQGLYVVDPNNSLTINGGTIKKGQWVVINAPNATITIAGNIDYTNETLNSLNDIPQVIIIANKIVINSNVTNIDSWLIAKKSGLTDGEIYTCDVVGDTVKICDKQLKINGPVITDKLFLRRTAGSGSGVNSGDPAEIINLRADAYLWSANRASINGHIQTIYVTELPPRF